MLAILRISSSSKVISQVTPFTGRVPLHPGEVVLLSIPVTSNASYQSIHLNQHLPLAAAAQQAGSQGMGMRGQWREVTSWRGGKKDGLKRAGEEGKAEGQSYYTAGYLLHLYAQMLVSVWWLVGW